MTDRRSEILPFLKWAGGKRWLVREHKALFDAAAGCRYVEPFLGSGAVFFRLAPKEALLSDSNRSLIETYEAIRDDWERVEKALRKHQRLHSESHYYMVRASSPRSGYAKAARFLYLNRTCFNGLYRVNRKGEFNVPIGTKSSVLLEGDDFKEWSNRLATAEIVSDDFEAVVDSCGMGDFIFADPPYTVRHNNNGFLKYNEHLFSWSDQERLKACLDRAFVRGAKVLVSNADHPSLKELYSGQSQQTAFRSSVMASDAAYRRETTELLIQYR